MTENEPFTNKILSITPAAPGWNIRIQFMELRPEAQHPVKTDDFTSSIAAWALVEQPDGGQSITEVEPVFASEWRMCNVTEYRRLYSDLKPEPGDPQITISMEIIPPISKEN
jgi:hypothetical protein